MYQGHDQKRGRVFLKFILTFTLPMGYKCYNDGYSAIISYFKFILETFKKTHQGQALLIQINLSCAMSLDPKLELDIKSEQEE